MLELGVIADDLTGAMMVASLLEREGIRCPLVTSVEGLAGLDDDAEAVVVGRKIRLAPAEDAVADARRSAEALLARGAKRLYYKYSALFMSTAEGNIGPISEALMAATGAEHVLFCPTWRGCTVYMGRLFVNDGMLHESGASRDPATPMTNSNLVEVLQAQSSVKVGLLPRRVLRGDTDAGDDTHLRKENRDATEFLADEVRAGTSFFIADAIEAGDVDSIAGLVINSAISTGADMLPIYLARRWRGGRAMSTPVTLLPPAPGHAAVLAGSCSGKSNRQLDAFEARHPLFRIDLPQAAHEPDLVERIARWAGQRLDRGPVGVATTTDQAGVERAQQALGREGAAQLADDLLGRVAERLYQMGVRKFVVAGGETSGTVIERLGISRLAVSAFDHLGGGYCHAAGPDPVSLVTKAGGAGEANFFEAALERMQAADAGVADGHV